MQDVIEWAGKIVGTLLAIFGVNRWLQMGLEKRVDKLEATGLQTIKGCYETRQVCPTAIRLEALVKDNNDFKNWLIRVESKLDAVIKGS